MALTELVTKLRRRINDRNSKQYSDDVLEGFLKDSVDELSTTKFYRKYEYNETNDCIYLLNTTTDLENFDETVILIQAQILINLSEAEKYSKQAIAVKDISRSIDTREIIKSIMSLIDELQDKLDDMIKDLNKGKNRANMGPKHIRPTTRIPQGPASNVTFKTKYNYGNTV